MADLYPEHEPYDHGMLDVGDGQRIYWEACGNPLGQPALVLHGGPGSGRSTTARRYFDPEYYRIILFDQRGCGRSTPHASEPGIDLSKNTTDHLIADLERLRGHLDVTRWLVLGGSWGSTLALAYALRHTDRVSGLVLNSVATTTKAEIDWITRGVGAFFPEAWEKYEAGARLRYPAESIVEAYHRLLMDPEPAVHQKAAADWCDWEMAIVAIHPNQVAHPRYRDPKFRLAFARLVTHYWRNLGFLEDGALLAGIHKLAGIPGVLIHGHLDISGPLVTPWRLARAWPGSRLVVVEQAGHDTRDPGMAEAIVAATEVMKRTT